MYAQAQKTTLSPYELQYRLLIDSFIPSELNLDIEGVRWFRDNLIATCYLSKEDVLEQLELKVPTWKIKEFLGQSLTKETINSLVKGWEYENSRNDRGVKTTH